VVVHLKSGKAYWKSVKDWFADSERLGARKIVFDKAKDEFAPDVGEVLKYVGEEQEIAPRYSFYM
jgi:hypothetical protein